MSSRRRVRCWTSEWKNQDREEAKDYLCTSMNRGRPAELPHRRAQECGERKADYETNTVAEERDLEEKGGGERAKYEKRERAGPAHDGRKSSLLQIPQLLPGALRPADGDLSDLLPSLSAPRGHTAAITPESFSHFSCVLPPTPPRVHLHSARRPGAAVFCVFIFIFCHGMSPRISSAIRTARADQLCQSPSACMCVLFGPRWVRPASPREAATR